MHINRSWNLKVWERLRKREKDLLGLNLGKGTELFVLFVYLILCLDYFQRKKRQFDKLGSLQEKGGVPEQSLVPPPQQILLHHKPCSPESPPPFSFLRDGGFGATRFWHWGTLRLEIQETELAPGHSSRLVEYFLPVVFPLCKVLQTGLLLLAPLREKDAMWWAARD